jgi:hypothetical protein
LALVAEVIHGTPTRFAELACFSFALGGNDGHPFPVPLTFFYNTAGSRGTTVGAGIPITYALPLLEQQHVPWDAAPASSK